MQSASRAPASVGTSLTGSGGLSGTGGRLPGFLRRNPQPCAQGFGDSTLTLPPEQLAGDSPLARPDGPQHEQVRHQVTHSCGRKLATEPHMIITA
jgi:hypothetical protein